MWPIILRALTYAGPVAIGFLSSDLLKYVQSIPLIGTWFKTDDKGQVPGWKIALAVVGFTALIIWLLRKLKIKL